MTRPLFERFHASDEEYDACERLWESLVAGAVDAAGADVWPRWTQMVFNEDGTRFDPGNPIIDGLSPRMDRAFRIIQWPLDSDDDDVGGVSAWLTFYEPEYVELPAAELVVNLHLTEESARVARELLRRWMSPRTSTDEMSEWLRGDLAALGRDDRHDRRDVRPLGPVLAAEEFIGAVEKRKQDGDVLVAFVATHQPLLDLSGAARLEQIWEHVTGILGFELGPGALVGHFSPHAFAVFLPEGSPTTTASLVARLHERAPRDDVEVWPAKWGQVRWACGVAPFRHERDSCLAQCELAAHRAEVDQARYPPEWWYPVWVPMGEPDADRDRLVSPAVSEAHDRLEGRLGRSLFD